MRKIDVVRVKYFLYCLVNRDAYAHGRYLKKKGCFHSVGDNFCFQPFNLPNDAKFIRFGNNVVVGAYTNFICHDAIHYCFNSMPENINNEEKKFKSYWTVIDIKDNCFIGAYSTIMPGVTIGNNTIIAAGSMVTKDVPDNSIVGGVPAKVIGHFDDLYKKREEYSMTDFASLKLDEKMKILWDKKDAEKKMQNKKDAE